MKMGAIQQIVLIALAPLVALGTGIGVAFTRSNEPAAAQAVVLHGVSTALAGAELPVRIDPSDIVGREDGAIGLGYEYAANGQASGDLAGSFTYVERGYIYLMDPSDPTSMVGDEFTGASFTVFPAGGPVNGITVEDKCLSCYEHGLESAALSEVPSWARGLVSRIAAGQGKGETAEYGYFTFTTGAGTFKGYATQDFREFVIRVEFLPAEAKS